MPIALTCGESAGIGPDLCLAAAQNERDFPLVCLADRDLLRQRAEQLKVDCLLTDYQPGRTPTRAADELCVLHMPLSATAVAGKLDVRNAPSVLRLIDRAVDGCLRGEFSALLLRRCRRA